MKISNSVFGKGVIELCQAATIKPRQIECSGFFVVDHNGQTRVYRLVSGQPDEQLWRQCDFPIKDDDLEKCALEVYQTATIKPRQIERSVVFFLLDYNRQTRVYRLVSGQPDVRMWRNHNFPTEEEDCIPHLR